MELSKEHLQTLAEIGLIAAGQKDAASAAAISACIEQHRETSVTPSVIRALLLLELGQGEAALELLGQVQTDDPSDMGLIYALQSLAHMTLKDWQKSHDQLDKALETEDEAIVELSKALSDEISQREG